MGQRRNITTDDTTERLIDQYEPNVSELFRRLFTAYYTTEGAGKQALIDVTLKELQQERERIRTRIEDDRALLNEIDERITELQNVDLDEIAAPSLGDDQSELSDFVTTAVDAGIPPEPTNDAVQNYAGKAGVPPTKFVELMREVE